MDSPSAVPAREGAGPAEARAPDADEQKLVAAVLQRDRKAAAQFVAAHIDAVHTYVRHRLMPRTEAVDDVVQDVFLAALKGLASFQGQSTVRTWLIAIARHKIEDVYRRRLRLPDAAEDLDVIADDEVSIVTSIEEQIDTTRRRAKARRILAGMPERYAIVLLWRYWEHRSTREIATAIQATEKGVERLLARARASFKAAWTKE